MPCGAQIIKGNYIMDSVEILKVAVKALDDKKAKDIEAIRVDDITILADYFVIASGTSSTQVKTLAEEVENKLAGLGVEPHHIEGKSSKWVLLDYSSVIVHVFYEEERQYYALEKLWKDGEVVDLVGLLG